MWGQPPSAVRPSVKLCGDVGVLDGTMVRIELITRIAAPIERCFDLSRSIDLHMASTDWTGERAIAGTTHGLIGLNQEVTWQGRHFGFKIRHTSHIGIFDRPRHFQDSMVRGAFKSFCHDHYFESVSGETVTGETPIGETLMKDLMQFEAPFGLLGRAVESILDRHMRALLRRRDECIKRVAESAEWRNFLPTKT
jgi:ligand-binding SRPBCC domain-containing protein